MIVIPVKVQICDSKKPELYVVLINVSESYKDWYDSNKVNSKERVKKHLSP